MRRQTSSGPGPSSLVRLRILIFHGYLLGGTGSNVYNAALAEALGRAGHEVHLLCQDRDTFAQEGVDAAGVSRRGAPASPCSPRTAPPAGRAAAIGGGTGRAPGGPPGRAASRCGRPS